MGPTINVIAGFAVCLGIAWGLLVYGDLPADVVPANYIQTILDPSLAWVAKIWFLIHYVLLDMQLDLAIGQLLVLTVLPWLVCGATIGLLTRNASIGFAVGFLAVVVSGIICWFIVFIASTIGIGLPGVGPAVAGSSLGYLLSLLSFQALAMGFVSGAGGAIGGILSRKRE